MGAVQLSVIIATIHRAAAIADICLPSLLKQDTSAFEVLIWDASDDDLTEKAVADRAEDFSEWGTLLRYARAPRRGLASQRNDAVKVAKGGLVFFIDDDSEVSPDGISSLVAAFAENAALKGAGLPLSETLRKSVTGTEANLPRRLLAFAKKTFWEDIGSARRIKKSALNVLSGSDLPGVAEWLSGGDMAFRREIFDELCFDERLERFGGYALGEDIDLSHRVRLSFNEPLLVVSQGAVIHHAAMGGRLDRVKMTAAYFYNSKIIRDNFNGCGGHHGIIPFLWEQRVLRALRMFESGSGVAEIIAGYRLYRAALKEDGQWRHTHKAPG